VRRIAVVTGKRGGYGAMKQMLKCIDRSQSMELSLIVTDQHLNAEFGSTINEVKSEFSVAAEVDMCQTGDAERERVEALGTCLVKMSSVLDDIRPDIIVIYGDRGEALVSALAAINYMIPVAHIQGGDVSGNVDELFRHAITKLSHFHFPSNAQSADRIIRMGENKERVFIVGDSHLDAIVDKQFTSADILVNKYDLRGGEPPIIVLQHPETSRYSDHFSVMCETMDAVLSQKRRTLVIYPCSDQGYGQIIQAINRYRSHPLVSIYKNIDASDFWGLLAISHVLVGNSSAGMVETPYFPIPSINIGERQKGRLCASNVIHCESSRSKIEDALRQIEDDFEFHQQVERCERPFGEGGAGAKIASTLEVVDLDGSIFEKRLAF